MMTCRFTKNEGNKGFTLVELVVSMGIAILVVSMVSSLYYAIVRDRTQYTTIAETENAGYEAMSVITQTIRNATSITSPVAAATSSSLTLVVPTSSLSPTVFSLATSTLKMAQASTTYSMTGSQVSISGLIFTNLTQSLTSGTVRIQFTVTDGSYSKVFYDSATIRKFKQQ